MVAHLCQSKKVKKKKLFEKKKKIQKKTKLPWPMNAKYDKKFFIQKKSQNYHGL